MSQDNSYNNSCQESSSFSVSPSTSPTAEDSSSVRFAHNSSFMFSDKTYKECTDEERLERRYTLIFLVHQQRERVKQGMERLFTIESLIDIINIPRSTGYRILEAENKIPGSGLLLINSAPKTDKKSKLTREQKEEIKDCIDKHDPKEYNINFALWTRKAVKELILLKYHVSLTEKAISKWLHRENMVHRCPAKYSINRSQEKIDEFINIKFPKIVEEYKGYLILFMDETHVQQDSTHERGFSYKGKAPIVHHNLKTSGHRVATAFIAGAHTGETASDVTADGSSKAENVIAFLKKIQASFRKQKVLIICDNAKIHHAKKVQEFLEHTRNLKMEFLPPYAPDINPIELINQAFKKDIRLKAAMTAEELIDYTYEYLAKLKDDKDFVKKFFTAPKVAYANAQ